MNDTGFTFLQIPGDRFLLKGEAIHFKHISSTNIWLKEKKEYLQKEGFVVYADRQTSGKGRRDKIWQGGTETHLFCSIVVHMLQNFDLIPSISLFASIAIYRTLKELNVQNISIKWPNDILIQGKKVCGILCESKQLESKTLQSKKLAVIVGIGMNLNGNETQFPREISDLVITLEMVLGKKVSRDQVLKQILDHLDQIIFQVKNNQQSSLFKEWENNSCSIGKQVRFLNQGISTIGTIIGLDSFGKLKLKDKTGNMIYLSSGEIVFL